MNQTDHKASRWTVAMSNATRKLVQQRLKISEPEFKIFRSFGIELQETDALSRLKRNDKNKTPSEPEIPIFTISQKVFACAPNTETADFEFIEELKSAFIPFSLRST